MIERLARFQSHSRYYTVVAGRDLLGDLTLIRVWGGRRSRRGGMRVEILPDPVALDARLAQIARRRRRRGYVQTESPPAPNTRTS